MASGDADLEAATAQACRFLALDGLLDGVALRALDPGRGHRERAAGQGLGPFAAELVICPD